VAGPITYFHTDGDGREVPVTYFYFDKAGDLIPVDEWRVRYGRFVDRVVVSTALGDDRQICTSWVGIATSEVPSRMFTSQLFERGSLVEELRRFETQPEAVAGHGDLVAVIGNRFFCPACWRTSQNIEDLRHGWCLYCRWNTAPAWEQRGL
jgi:hypothetical protein